MKTKLHVIATLMLLLLAGNAFAQSITVPTESVTAGGTATVVLAFTAGGATTNLDFNMFYDETVVDEAALSLGVVCDATAIGITALDCTVNTTENRVTGIGVNFAGPLTSGDFATVTLPTLPGAAVGDSTNAININFSTGGVVTPANSTWTLTVTGGALTDQTITSFTSAPATLTYLGATGALAAVADSGLTVTDFGVLSGPCTVVAGNVVATSGAGTCTVTANQAGNATFNPAPQVTLGITINPAGQTITGFMAAPAAGNAGGTSTLSANGGASGELVTFGSSTMAVCTVSGNTVTYVTAGTCSVTADQAGNVNFIAATQESFDITVGLGDQVITGFAAAPSPGSVGGSSALSATGGDSGEPITFASTTMAVCTVAGNTATYVTVGTCNVTADQAGNANFNAASQVSLDITVNDLTDQDITGFAAAPDPGTVEGTSTLSATGGASGEPVTFASNTMAVCTVSGDEVTYVTAGTCTVTADQDGNATFNPAAQVMLDITVNQGDQTISAFTAAPAAGSIGNTSNLSATASSGLPVTFDSSTPAICTVAGNVVSYVAVGQCDLTADQAGDANYTVAEQVTLSIDVTDQPVLPALGIPTLSPIGLGAMILLMLGLGGLLIRRNTYL